MNNQEQALRSNLERAGAAITAAEECYNCLRDLLRNLDTAYEAMCEELKETRGPLPEPTSLPAPGYQKAFFEGYQAAIGDQGAREPVIDVPFQATTPTLSTDFQAGYQQALKDLGPQFEKKTERAPWPPDWRFTHLPRD